MPTRLRTRLTVARENGYLDARCREASKVLNVYGFWCWRLKVPLVWMERCTPHSRYGRVHLDMFTTANALTVSGQAELQALDAAGRISAHDASWDRIPVRDLERFAAAVLHAATRIGNSRTNRAASATGIERWRPGRAARAATA